MRVIRENIRIARNLHRIREGAGLAQLDLAELVGRDVRTIRGYEAGRVAIRLQPAGDICDAIGVSLNELTR